MKSLSSPRLFRVLSRPVRGLTLGASLWVMALGISHGQAPAAKPARTPLWPAGQAPNGDGTMDTANAFLTIHQPEKPNGAAFIICPGGGYGGLVVTAEGHGIANWLNQHGITGAVLEYRLPKGRRMVPLLDAQRAIRTVRSQAEALHLDPHRIGIIGFSAGGHLASTADTHFDTGEASSSDPIQKVSCRPDFAILVYPVVTMGAGTHGGSKKNLLGPDPKPEWIEYFSNEKHVTDQTPPTFLAHAVDDKVVPISISQGLYQALQEHKIPSKLLELPNGGHGLSGYKGPSWDAWQKQSLEWLASLKVIPD